MRWLERIGLEAGIEMWENFAAIALWIVSGEASFQDPFTL